MVTGPRAVVGDLDALARQGHPAKSRPAVPDDVGDPPLAQRPPEQLAAGAGHLVGAGRQVGLDAGRGQRRPGAGQLPGQRAFPEAGHGRTHLGQRVPGELVHIGDLGAGTSRVDLGEPAGQLGLDRDDRQRVAKDVMQVAGHPGALVGDGEVADLLVGLPERDRLLDDLADSPHAESGRQRGERQKLPAVPMVQIADQRGAADADDRDDDRLDGGQHRHAGDRHIKVGVEPGDLTARHHQGGQPGQHQQRKPALPLDKRFAVPPAPVQRESRGVDHREQGQRDDADPLPRSVWPEPEEEHRDRQVCCQMAP